MKGDRTQERQQTIRQQIIDLLSTETLGVRDISQEISIMEKEVYDHLVHIERSIAAHGGRLIVYPYRCVACGYVFRDRKKLTKPGRCPSCKGSHIETAKYHIAFKKSN